MDWRLEHVRRMGGGCLCGVVFVPAGAHQVIGICPLFLDSRFPGNDTLA